MKNSAIRPAFARLSTSNPSETLTPIYGRGSVSFSSQLAAYLSCRFTPRAFRRADNLAGGALLSFFGFYLVFHIASAWPRIWSALQGGGAL